MCAADVVEQPILKDGASAPPSPTPIRYWRRWDHNHNAYRALHSGASGAARRTVRCSFGVGVVFALLLIYSQSVTRQTPTYLEAGRPDGAASVALQESAGGSEALLGVARALGINVAISSVWQNGYLVPAVLRHVSTERRRQWEAARDLYERERPHFKRAAHEFELHPYWRGLSADEASFEALVGARAADMAAQLQQGRDDFKVEKDKCAMASYLARQCLPMPPVLRVWRDNPEAVVEEIAQVARERGGGGGSGGDGEGGWPVFLKMCHLTQGVEDSVRRLPSAAWVRASLTGLAAFVRAKWAHRAYDEDRFFAAASNVLTRDLPPGALLQAGFAQPVELKVLVLWGRAYVATLAGAEHNGGVITRDGTYEPGCGSCFFPTAPPRPLAEEAQLSWIAQEAHLPRVWLIAETAAAAMGADQVRIDVFIRRGAPAAAAINELSLSSGASLHFHAEFAARLWTQFQPGGAHLPYPGAAAWEARAPGAALHDLGGPRAGAPTPNQNAVLRGLREMRAWDSNVSRQIGACLKVA